MEALDRLSRAGIIEGRPGGVYEGNRPMTRYEFAVAIAACSTVYPVVKAACGTTTPSCAIASRLSKRVRFRYHRREVTDMITALATEFRDEPAVSAFASMLWKFAFPLWRTV
jgi:hypothetical protein